MDTNRAELFLELHPPYSSDDVDEVYEMKVFDIKDFCLKNTVIKKLFEARIKKLKQYAEAHAFLTEEKLHENADSVPYSPLNKAHLLGFLDNYAQEMNKMKLMLSSTFEPHQLTGILKTMIALQQEYLQFYQSHTSFLSSYKESFSFEEELNLRQQMDVGKLIRILTKSKITNLSKEAVEEAPSDFTEFYLELLRVEKQLALESQ